MYQIVEVKGRKHVVIKAKDRGFYTEPNEKTGLLQSTGEPIPSSNYRGMGFSLVGILLENETLEEFFERKAKIKEQREYAIKLNGWVDWINN